MKNKEPPVLGELQNLNKRMYGTNVICHKTLLY